MQILPGKVNEGMTLIETQENRDPCVGKQDKASKTREGLQNQGRERQRTKTNFAYFSVTRRAAWSIKR